MSVMDVRLILADGLDQINWITLKLRSGLLLSGNPDVKNHDTNEKKLNEGLM